MEKTYVIILIILLGGVAQYNISDGDRISQYLHELNIRMIVFSPLKILRSGYICEILKNLLIIINLTRA